MTARKSRAGAARKAPRKAARKPPGRRKTSRPSAGIAGRIPAEGDAEVEIGGRRVRLTNLGKPFWPELGLTKGDLLRYYLEVSAALLPHIADRAMVMKRYPNGATGEFFFMKRAPTPRPDWIRTCSIDHGSAGVIDFPVIDDAASLLWVVNLGCIDLNPWYARCGDPNRPDYLHFDLDPVPGASFEKVIEAAFVVREALEALGVPCHAKTTGSRGIHVYVPIALGPTQKEVWAFAKEIAASLASRRPDLLTSEYRIARRPAGRVLVDYNQNAWGRTLASVYSVRPTPLATVSTPVTWQELARGLRIEDFRLQNVPARVRKLGDAWAPVAASRGRYRLERLLEMARRT